MARFITPVKKRTAQAGEKLVAERLHSHLEEDYLCWYDVPIGPKRLHPDFVILHPRRGLLVLEVKDWKRETLRRIDKHYVDLLTGAGGLKRESNPLEQLRQYAHAVVDRLSSDPQLQPAQFDGDPRSPHLAAAVVQARPSKRAAVRSARSRSRGGNREDSSSPRGAAICRERGIPPHRL